MRKAVRHKHAQRASLHPNLVTQAQSVRKQFVSCDGPKAVRRREENVLQARVQAVGPLTRPHLKPLTYAKSKDNNRF
jgi:hypothetical protein